MPRGYGAYQSLGDRVFCSRANATDALKGYAITGISLNSPSVLRASYYDDYGFIGRNGFDPSKVGFIPLGGYVQPYANPRGKLTGEIVAESIYVPPNHFFKATYYDTKGRVTGRNTTDLTGWGGDFTAYDFTGKPTRGAHRHVSSLDTPNVMLGEYTYSYDDAGRLTDTRYSLNGAAPVDVAHNTYDELGRLKGRRLGARRPQTRPTHTTSARGSSQHQRRCSLRRSRMRTRRHSPRFPLSMGIYPNRTGAWRAGGSEGGTHLPTTGLTG